MPDLETLIKYGQTLEPHCASVVLDGTGEEAVLVATGFSGRVDTKLFPRSTPRRIVTAKNVLISTRRENGRLYLRSSKTPRRVAEVRFVQSTGEVVEITESY